MNQWNQWKKTRKGKKGSGDDDDDNVDALMNSPTLKSLHVFALHDQVRGYDIIHMKSNANKKFLTYLTSHSIAVNDLRSHIAFHPPLPRDQDVDEQGRDNHLRVVRVVEFLASQGYLVKMTAASATASPATVTAASTSIDKPVGTVEEGHASGGNASGGTGSGGINEVRTIEDTLASIDHACVLIVFMTQSYMSRVSGLGGIGEKGKGKHKGSSHYHDLCMQLFLYATSSQLQNHHQGAGAFLVVTQEETCRDPTQWQGPSSLLASSLSQPPQTPPQLSTDTQKNEPSPPGAEANNDTNPLTAAGAGVGGGDLSQNNERTFTPYIDNVHDAG